MGRHLKLSQNILWRIYQLIIKIKLNNYVDYRKHVLFDVFGSMLIKTSNKINIIKL